MCGGQRLVEQAEPVAVLGRNRHGHAEAHAVGLVDAAVAGPALAFVGDRNDRLVDATQPIGEVLVDRRNAGAGIDEKDDDRGVGQRLLGLPAHAGREPLAHCVFQPGRVDDAEAEVAETCLALAASHA